MNPKVKFRRIENADHSLRIDFQRDHDGVWTYQPALNSRCFDSYAAALVHAQLEYPWISNAVTPHGWHVELTRGHVYQAAEYTSQFGDHAHCSACWKKLMENPPDGANIEHSGYVTKYHRPDGSNSWQWNWLCINCFNDLSDSLQWLAREL